MIDFMVHHLDVGTPKEIRSFISVDASITSGIMMFIRGET